MSDPEDPEDPFADAAVLGALERADRARLARQSRRRQLDTGQILFLEGDQSDSVVVLVSGRMKVLTYSKAGAELVLNAVLPGETVGEIGVLSGAPRSATIQATEESVVLSLPRTVIVDLVSSRPALALALLRRLSELVRRATGLASDLVFLDLRQRVAKYLLAQDGDGTAAAGHGLTQSDLAANVGASRQRVNACLRDFQQQGWVTIEPRRVRVRDARALALIVAL